MFWRNGCTQLCAGREVCDLRRLSFFFFQAEDGIRDLTVTGVQTCALPIYLVSMIQFLYGNTPAAGTSNSSVMVKTWSGWPWTHPLAHATGFGRSLSSPREIGRASCREGG